MERIQKNYEELKKKSELTEKFINGKKIVIDNSNLETLVTVSNRLYKDGKVFYLFKEYLGESTAKRFFNDWLKLI